MDRGGKEDSERLFGRDPPSCISASDSRHMGHPSSELQQINPAGRAGGLTGELSVEPRFEHWVDGGRASELTYDSNRRPNASP